MRTKTATAGRLPSAPTNTPSKAAPVSRAAGSQIRLIRNLIWLYIILWLIEGGLRRWILPGLASPLLLVRDPLAFAIYFLAIANNVFPISGFITWGALLAVLSFINAMVMGHGNLFVAFYGVRCDFLHVPLIFVMSKVLRHKDIIAMAKVGVWIAAPYTALLVAQFYQPQDAWVNRGVGGSLDGAGFSGALDRFRPPGTFSFITGPSQLYPLLTACWFILLLERKLPVWTMAISAAGILVAIPISISRTLFLSVAVVAVAGMAAMLAGGKHSFKLVFQVLIVGALLYLLAGKSDVFKEGMEAFSARWEGATTEQGGFQEAIVDRVLNDLFGSFDGIRGYGVGTGFSTNVGQKSLTAEVGFGGSESEWGRLLYDDGFILGSFMVAYRIALAGFLVLVSFRAWRRKSTISMIFASACFITVLYGQWGQTTSLGTAAIGAGLVLAAENITKSDIFQKSTRSVKSQKAKRAHAAV